MRRGRQSPDSRSADEPNRDHKVHVTLFSEMVSVIPAVLITLMSDQESDEGFN